MFDQFGFYLGSDPAQPMWNFTAQVPWGKISWPDFGQGGALVQAGIFGVGQSRANDALWRSPQLNEAFYIAFTCENNAPNPVMVWDATPSFTLGPNLELATNELPLRYAAILSPGQAMTEYQNVAALQGQGQSFTIVNSDAGTPGYPAWHMIKGTEETWLIPVKAIAGATTTVFTVEASVRCTNAAEYDHTYTVTYPVYVGVPGAGIWEYSKSMGQVQGWPRPVPRGGLMMSQELVLPWDWATGTGFEQVAQLYWIPAYHDETAWRPPGWFWLVWTPQGGVRQLWIQVGNSIELGYWWAAPNAYGALGVLTNDSDPSGPHVPGGIGYSSGTANFVGGRISIITNNITGHQNAYYQYTWKDLGNKAPTAWAPFGTTNSQPVAGPPFS